MVSCKMRYFIILRESFIGKKLSFFNIWLKTLQLLRKSACSKVNKRFTLSLDIYLLFLKKVYQLTLGLETRGIASLVSGLLVFPLGIGQESLLLSTSEEEFCEPSPGPRKIKSPFNIVAVPEELLPLILRSPSTMQI